MNTFDPTKHPRGNQTTGHAGQFAVKQQTSPEIDLEDELFPRPPEPDPNRPVTEADRAAWKAQLLSVATDLPGADPDVQTRIADERVKEDWANVFGWDRLDERVAQIPLGTGEQDGWARMAGDAASHENLSPEERQARSAVRSITAQLEKLPAGTRLALSDDYQDSKWRPWLVLQPDQNRWDICDSVLSEDSLTGFDRLTGEDYLALAGGRFETDQTYGSTRCELVSTGSASDTGIPEAQRAEAGAALVAQMIRQDQARGWVPDEPLADALAHVDISVYLDEAIPHLRVGEHPGDLADKIRDELARLH